MAGVHYSWDPFHDALFRKVDSWSYLLDAGWFAIAAPFVLPAIPIALRSGARGALAVAARLGAAHYLQLLALISIAAGPFVILGRMARPPVARLIANGLDLYEWDGVITGLLTSVQLVVVVTSAIVVAACIRAHTLDAENR